MKRKIIDRELYMTLEKVSLATYVILNKGNRVHILHAESEKIAKLIFRKGYLAGMRDAHKKQLK